MRIATIGAGISGLTIAAALQHFDPQVEIQLYERDTVTAPRFQGYSLGMKGEYGISVLRQLGIFEQLRADMVPITNFVFCDQKGQALLELPEGSEKHLNLRVRRDRLKEALRAAAPDVKINYGMDCTGYVQTPDAIEVLFRNGQTVQADYVVAADGVGSALRQQFVADNKRYLGLTSIVGEAPITLDLPLLAGGYFMMLADSGASAFCYREASGIHFSFTEHAESDRALAEAAPAALLQRIQEATAKWAQPVPEIASAIDPATIVVRGYYDKEPLEHVRQGRLWLLGDAAHPMSPFQGQGANMAMLDALQLAELLAARASTNGETQVAAHKLEADIVARGRKAVIESRSAAARLHTASRFKQMNRDIGFRMASFFIKLVSRKS
jgi:salicylate hydroxylase